MTLKHKQLKNAPSYNAEFLSLAYILVDLLTLFSQKSKKFLVGTVPKVW